VVRVVRELSYKGSEVIAVLGTLDGKRGLGGLLTEYDVKVE